MYLVFPTIGLVSETLRSSTNEQHQIADSAAQNSGLQQSGYSTVNYNSFSNFHFS
jgi:hypothetical protein